MSTPSSSDAWRVWDRLTQYGRILQERAMGKLPKMESSQAAGRFLKPLVAPRDRVLDVGCGAGHYLRSLKGIIEVPFSYTGVDSTAAYIDLAREAWQHEAEASFQVGDVFNLPFEDRSFEIVLSCNLLLHLPSIERPLRELIRVSRRHVVVRTLVGNRSFRIQEVYAGTAAEPEFDDRGEPRRWNYYNIYSQAFLESVLRSLPGVTAFRILPDEDFSAQRILQDAMASGATNATTIVGDWQVNGYVLQPWHFVHIQISPP